ncbi:peptidase M23-like protein [Plasticicumulans lactativorans]|uniref:Peptidase M23-like protein n=1 Tax=Plasticicumulans lactativorans TaxID=1133106 RepID=A0A4R2L481_9GAMM|nr:M23 family metallopeptidase [Plasticicumulans lactativorans]TCO80542.1 peptidase M23-like protein [Plasticicumulans lactativorans]
MKTLPSLCALLIGLATCAGSAAADRSGADAACDATGDTARYTPLTARVADAPVPVAGSDGRLHVVYELDLVNATGDRATLSRLDVFDADTRAVVATLDAAELGRRLVVRERNAAAGTLGAAQAGIVYLHLMFDRADALPGRLAHALAGTVGAAALAETAGCVRVAPQTALVFDAPLRGPRYIAGDGCCDAVRHVRATLPMNGRFVTAQRFAIDWEQLDEQGRIFVGDPKATGSYVIYGKPVYAVADASVAAAVDGLDDSPPGQLPPGLPLEQADGNHVVLDLGDGRYALYAHLKPRSVQVSQGQRVHRGQLLGHVGSSGNSSEPHLHFQITDGPSPLASNGLPYRLRSFSATRRGTSTEAFDQAIVDQQPIATEPVAGAAQREQVLPLDLWIVDFPE